MTHNFPSRNLLADESSPYLRQHAHNPVHWRPWGPAALAEAQASDKPLLLSIGYSACHWCHVMAHESFENESIAGVMNALFVNVKVDREERPDIDQIYMSALHAMGEQGGWPLTMFLDPQGRPFWGGTYFPPASRYGRPGFPELLKAISHAWATDREKIHANGAAMQQHFADLSASPQSSLLPGRNAARDFAATLLPLHDPENGGVRGAPKFPNAPIAEAWLRLAGGRADSEAGRAFLRTIDRMSSGGIYDHIGGGLSRYAVDGVWLVPHFEKMLYDNAHYLRALVWADRLDSRETFRQRIEETIAWAEREMRLAGGAFASSLDADSEGEEGKYYVWSANEIRALLGTQANRFLQRYDISDHGNFEGGNIANLLDAEPLPPTEEAEFASMRARLLEARNQRIRPGRDDKVLADWNGYFIRALAEAAFAFKRPDWLTLARGAFRFISESMCTNDRLAHSWLDSVAVRPAMATDYAAMAAAGLTLYQTTGEPEFLDNALAWQAVLDSDYADGAGGYFLTSKDAQGLIARPRCDVDEANPSGASQILENLVRFAALSGRSEFLEKAWALSGNLQASLSQQRFGVAGYHNALHTLQHQRHVHIQAENRDAAESFLDCLRSLADPALTFEVSQPNRAMLFMGAEIAGAANGTRTVLCTQETCSAPMRTAKELAAALGETAA